MRGLLLLRVLLVPLRVTHVKHFLFRQYVASNAFLRFSKLLLFWTSIVLITFLMLLVLTSPIWTLYSPQDHSNVTRTLIPFEHCTIPFTAQRLINSYHFDVVLLMSWCILEVERTLQVYVEIMILPVPLQHKKELILLYIHFSSQYLFQRSREHLPCRCSIASFMFQQTQSESLSSETFKHCFVISLTSIQIWGKLQRSSPSVTAPSKWNASHCLPSFLIMDKKPKWSESEYPL